MSVTFTKLFSSITESTVWCEPAHTRLVWITMLAMADKQGRVWASVPGLANRARVPVEDTEKALATFAAPDKYSRTTDHDGRRIEPIDGGWRLLNYAKYREIRDQEDRRDYQRNWDREHRGRGGDSVHPTEPDKSDRARPDKRGSDSKRHNAEAEAEAGTSRSKALSANADDFPGFIRFWNLWPKTTRKVARKKCLEVWKRKGFEAQSAVILAHVELMTKTEGWLTGFEPMPMTYLNAERWDGADLTAPVSGEKPWFIRNWASIVAEGEKHKLFEKNFPTGPASFRSAVLNAAGITKADVKQAEAQWK